MSGCFFERSFVRMCQACAKAASLKHAKGRIEREYPGGVGMVFQTQRISVGGGRRGWHCRLRRYSGHHSTLRHGLDGDHGFRVVVFGPAAGMIEPLQSRRRRTAAAATPSPRRRRRRRRSGLGGLGASPSPEGRADRARQPEEEHGKHQKHVHHGDSLGRTRSCRFCSMSGLLEKVSLRLKS